LKKIIIIGGGISGLTTAILLAKAGISPVLIEKKIYPFHRVCGEYISNETVPFLRSLGLFPEKFSPPALTRFQLTSVNGKAAHFQLDLGGFGISRYHFDQFLYEKAIAAGVHFLIGDEVSKIQFADNVFWVQTKDQTLESDLVIGTFGKRSKIDVQLGRNFIKKRSPYLGVKYHVRTEHPSDLIALHNFKGGYCGISNIEEGKTNLCYLTHRNNLKAYGNIAAMEEAVLYKNPFLKSIFRNSEFLFEKPETINEISFETKGPVEDHILMAGDAAGMITPLCGNGMAMAIHSAKLLSAQVIRFCEDSDYKREQLEKDYSRTWNKIFEKRLWAGRQIQRLFGSEWTSDLAVNLLRYSTPLANSLVRKTHGDPFDV
jgi:menaquinone-9 beta-reductase